MHLASTICTCASIGLKLHYSNALTLHLLGRVAAVSCKYVYYVTYDIHEHIVYMKQLLYYLEDKPYVKCAACHMHFTRKNMHNDCQMHVTYRANIHVETCACHPYAKCAACHLHVTCILLDKICIDACYMHVRCLLHAGQICM